MSPKEDRKSAGLGSSNQMHNFLCFNGDAKRPRIFANLLKNGVKQDVELRKKIEMLGNEQKFMNKVEKTFWATRNFKNIDKSYQDQPKLLEETLDAKPRMASPPLATYTAPSPQFELEDSVDKRQRVFKESM